MLFHFIVVILWSHTKHDNKLIAMQATLSYACGISDIPLKGETIGQNLRQIAAKFPERTALISEYQQYRANYSEFLEQVEQVAKALMAHGIRRGDRVGIWSPNRYEWVLVQYATALMGAIMVNINPGYKLSGLRYALEQSRIDLLIASSHFRKTDYIKMLDELRPDCLYPKQTVIIDRDWATFLSSASQVSDARLAEREASLQFDDPVNIQYTSGTTGYPKGATLSHHNILNNGFFIGERLKYTDVCRFLFTIVSVWYWAIWLSSLTGPVSLSPENFSIRNRCYRLSKMKGVPPYTVSRPCLLQNWICPISPNTI